jgi:glycosyltransferase involved in cell wall biosynthesis
MSTSPPTEASQAGAPTAPKPRAVIVSTSLPRRCGLATFTGDLRGALTGAGWSVDVCAIDRDGLAYGPEVVHVVRHDDPEDYQRAARALAVSGVDVVLFQHEYGIFGGADGAYVLHMARQLRWLGVPYVVTLHTILDTPSRGQVATMRALCHGAARVTVFTDSARQLAATTGVADPARLVVMPHGAPPVLREPADPQALEADLDILGDGPVLSTFGLLSAGKGLEVMIEALPEIARRHPDVRYVIAGATHPDILRRDGESYRQALIDRAEALGVGDNVSFINAFLTDAELGALLARTDLYVTPYLSAQQACSGTLTFALAAGVPAVSTAYRYAVDMLTKGDAPAGVLTSCGDASEMASAIGGLLDDRATLESLRKAADAIGARLTWPSVGRQFATVLTAAANAPLTRPKAYPLVLSHLDTLVDDIGIMQFAQATRPDTDSGYCVDDVARLAIVACGLQEGTEDPLPRRWVRSSLRFLDAAVTATGSRNFLDYGGRWLDRPHVGDHLGRAVWGLGVVMGTVDDAAQREHAHAVLQRSLPAVADLSYLRSIAYAVLGLAHTEERELLGRLADRLAGAFDERPGWYWFEEALTYDNARLPQALIAAGVKLGRDDLVQLGLTTLDWYLHQVGIGGDSASVLKLVGNRWRRRMAVRRGGSAGRTHLGAVRPGPTRATSRLRWSLELDEGDEQPLDAAAVVEALAHAWSATGEERYRRLCGHAFTWFYGVNRYGLALYAQSNGACHDGLGRDGINANCGAESTLAYYQALHAAASIGAVDVAAPRQAPARIPSRKWPIDATVRERPRGN